VSSANWLADVQKEEWRHGRRLVMTQWKDDEGIGPIEVEIVVDTGRHIVGLRVNNTRLPLFPEEARMLGKRLQAAAKEVGG